VRLCPHRPGQGTTRALPKEPQGGQRPGEQRQGGKRELEIREKFKRTQQYLCGKGSRIGHWWCWGGSGGNHPSRPSVQPAFGLLVPHGSSPQIPSLKGEEKPFNFLFKLPLPTPAGSERRMPTSARRCLVRQVPFSPRPSPLRLGGRRQPGGSAFPFQLLESVFQLPRTFWQNVTI